MVYTITLSVMCNIIKSISIFLYILTYTPVIIPQLKVSDASFQISQNVLLKPFDHSVDSLEVYMHLCDLSKSVLCINIRHVYIILLQLMAFPF